MPVVKRLLGWVAVLALLGCGSEVLVVDEDGQLVEVGGQGGPGDTGCTPCVGGDCGLCSGMDGADYRCDAERPVEVGCFEMGGLFEGEDGYYVCWSCP